jgi:hypothetical protein
MWPEKVFSSATYSSAVVLLPDVAANLDLFEQATGFNLGRFIGDLLRRRRRPFSRVALANRVIDLLDLGEEAIEACGERVPGAPERQVAAGSQEPVCLAVADRRIDPVPSRRGVDELERLGLAVPSLERRDVDLNRTAGQVAARPPRELRAHLDADHGKPRSSRGRVALPVAQPISSRRAPGSSAASVTRSSNSSSGYEGLAAS